MLHQITVAWLLAYTVYDDTRNGKQLQQFRCRHWPAVSVPMHKLPFEKPARAVPAYVVIRNSRTILPLRLYLLSL